MSNALYFKTQSVEGLNLVANLEEEFSSVRHIRKQGQRPFVERGPHAYS
ncbi:MAG: hypothetical protein KDA91_05710 [Planctomycetaceae bacterium]|nr:hypothetical protein [Planctomycetaceae bacterium]